MATELFLHLEQETLANKAKTIIYRKACIKKNQQTIIAKLLRKGLKKIKL